MSKKNEARAKARAARERMQAQKVMRGIIGVLLLLAVLVGAYFCLS